MTLYYPDPEEGANLPVKSNIVLGEHVPVHDLHALPGTVETDIAASKTALQSLTALISGGRFAVELSSTLITYLSNLPTLATYLNTLQGAITSARMAVDLAATPTANLATLAGAITSARMAVNVDTTTTGKLDSIITGVATAAFKTGQVGSIGTSADVNFASQVLVKGLRVKNISTSGQVLYVYHQATPTSTNCLPLLPGEWSNHLECTNANQVYMRASASGAAAAYDGS